MSNKSSYHSLEFSKMTTPKSRDIEGTVLGDEPLLAASGLDAGYHGHPVVRNLDLVVRAGEVVALLGPNGAGKTTTLLALAGELAPLAGTVAFAGRTTRSPLHARARQGLAFVPEERSIFPQLTTAENIRVGRCDQRAVLELFPELEPLLPRKAGLLSGGEQQMLTLGRALARRPALLLADELSLGLAPLIVTRLLEAVRAAADRDGVGVLLVEQHVRRVLPMADRAYVMRGGRVVLQGVVADVAGKLEEAYLGEELGQSPAQTDATRSMNAGTRDSSGSNAGQ
jgi:branched-chain amino acid transport system ATP-binding protein